MGVGIAVGVGTGVGVAGGAIAAYAVFLARVRQPEDNAKTTTKRITIIPDIIPHISSTSFVFSSIVDYLITADT